jgi:hypothetical protein
VHHNRFIVIHGRLYSPHNKRNDEKESSKIETLGHFVVISFHLSQTAGDRISLGSCFVWLRKERNETKKVEINFGFWRFLVGEKEQTKTKI